MNKFLPVVFLLICCKLTSAQDSSFRPLFKHEKSTDVWIGYDLQGNWSDKTKTIKYLEVGIGKGRYFYHIGGVTGGGIYLAEEISLNSSKQIYGTKLGAFVHWLFDAGCSLVYYSDLENGNLKLRPELGVGMGRMRIVIGYNLPTINNKAMSELQEQNAQITIQIGFGIKKKEIKNPSNQ